MNITTTLLTRTAWLACAGVVLVNCGGSSSDEAQSPAPQQFTVTTQATAGGSVSPVQRQVNAGQTTSFTISPDSGFSLASAQGCNGSLAAGTFTTGVIQANCTVNVTFNALPIADAGANQTVETGNLVTLDGSASSDAEGDALSYAWQVTQVPEGASVALSSATDVRPSFTPQVDGVYVFQLVVSDPYGSSEPAQVQVEATTANLPPVANAGPNQSVATGAQVELDGRQSSDPEGQPLSYSWIMVSRPNGSMAELSATDTATTQFTADVAGEFVIELTVNDGELDSEPVQVLVEATTANVPPVANAGSDQTVIVNSVVQLSGAASSDADGDQLSYHWQFVSIPDNSEAELINARDVEAEFTPDQVGNYVIRLTVDDGVDSATDQVVIEAIAARLQLQEKDFFSGYRDLNFPYSSSGTMSVTLVGSNTVTVGEYRLVALGQDYVITDLVASDDNNLVVPEFAGLVDGQIIAAGDTVDFRLLSPKTGNQQANVVFSFRVEGTDKTFQVRRLLTTN
ncbi:PKD domain-containing protein [Alkalimonas sp. MEB108]|uniref:PKD domain-containing protein n=1 Tax=Alkalimonas cellulosilytica TaxID=3058395 RepID=A0ABU7JA91_9GAMM|nr:PKD domain-containing protein [Alkalimonas sp. MEB108]MEE2003417.1 PKD domain-containing protein [Alkalimonas sp. MEB108]